MNYTNYDFVYSFHFEFPIHLVSYSNNLCHSYKNHS